MKKLITVSLLMLITIFLQGCQNNKYKILSDSMAPTIIKGAVVTVKEVDSNTLQVNDIIIYTYSSTPQIIVAERIISIELNEGELIFYVKGDNNHETNLVLANAVIGKVVKIKNP